MLNGTIGLCLLLGGLRHHEQSYNLPGARAFLSVVIPLAVFALILPNFTVVAPGPTLSMPQAITIAVLTLALYGVFLTMQTVRHRSFFQDPVEADSSALPEAPHGTAHTVAFHTTCLALTLVPAVYLTEELGHIVEHAVKAMSAPAGAGRRHRGRAGAGAGGDGRVAGHACEIACNARSTSRSARCSPPSA